MRQINTAVVTAFTVLAAWATPSVAAPIIDGYTSAAVHQRTGPGSPYAVIQVIPAGAKVQIFGCLTGLTWCDTLYANKRGWVSGRYLTIPDSGQRHPVITFGFSFGVPLIGPWWGYPGHWPPPRPPEPPSGPGGGGPPHHGPGDDKPPPHHGSGDNGPGCSVPGKPPCGPGNAGPGGWPPPGGKGPECGVPGKPPCGSDNNPGPGTGGPPRRGDNAQCGVPGKPPCHDTTYFGSHDDIGGPNWRRSNTCGPGQRRGSDCVPD